MIKLWAVLLFAATTLLTSAQRIDPIINITDVSRIESALSADSMMGRKAFTPAANKAADFISGEFRKIGLTPLQQSGDFKQQFSMVSARVIDVSANIDGRTIDPKNIIPFTSASNLNITERSGYTKKYIKAGSQFRKEVADLLSLKENLLVFVHSSFSQNFARLNNRRQNLFKSDKNLIFALGDYPTNRYNVYLKQSLTEQGGSNVVGIIPGKSRKEEMVIFSGHYDHIGIARNSTDSIYNGANDDASGITAVIEMARYYKALQNNERALVFVAFTAEELGGYGSQYFSSLLKPEKVVAMLNVEMIGTESKWGRNSAYITGFDKTDFGKILQNNLTGSVFNFYPDPYIQQDLFYRSDNATLARLGVPAHTISTSKMDDEPNYHKVTDELTTLDLDNMTEIIKAIITSAQTIVKGSDTPSRVSTEQLSR